MTVGGVSDADFALHRDRASGSETPPTKIYLGNVASATNQPNDHRDERNTQRQPYNERRRSVNKQFQPRPTALRLAILLGLRLPLLQGRVELSQRPSQVCLPD